MMFTVILHGTLRHTLFCLRFLHRYPQPCLSKYSASSSSASVDNIGFAIPINSIMNIVEPIIEESYVSKPYIGVSVVDVLEENQQYGIPASTVHWGRP